MSSPERQLRLGAERISVFRNDSDAGVFFTASLTGRRFQTDAGDWQSSTSYTAAQLAQHICLCQTVLDYMIANDPPRRRRPDGAEEADQGYVEDEPTTARPTPF